LKPWAAEVVKKFGEMSLAGEGYPTPRNQCWPEQVPFVFINYGMQVLQQPDKITILYPFDHQFRQVRMNQSHNAQATPSWYGDSVGHYEGDELVIDTVGVKIGPYSMLDWYGTPFTEVLHLVERYRLLDYEATMEALERDAKEHIQTNNPDNGPRADPNYKGKGLQIQVTVEDDLSALKTSNGTLERTLRSRVRTSQISEGWGPRRDQVVSGNWEGQPGPVFGPGRVERWRERPVAWHRHYWAATGAPSDACLRS
jgi:hypothetical protein